MVFDVIGLAGVFLILSAYFLVQSGRINPGELRYPGMNLAGAILILISLTNTFNLASFVIEIAWIGISLYGIARIIGRRRGGKT